MRSGISAEDSPRIGGSANEGMRTTTIEAWVKTSYTVGDEGCSGFAAGSLDGRAAILVVGAGPTGWN